MITNLAGIPIIASEHVGNMVQRRINRSRRINKKWLKRYGKKFVPDTTHVLVIDDPMFGGKKIIAHPSLVEKLRKACEHIPENGSMIKQDRLWVSSQQPQEFWNPIQNFDLVVRKDNPFRFHGPIS